MNTLIEIAATALSKQNAKFIRDFNDLRLKRNISERKKALAGFEQMCTKSVSEILWNKTGYPVNQDNYDFYWLLDALNGRENFMQGIPLLSSVLTLVHDSSIKFCLINLPISNELYICDERLTKQNAGYQKVNNNHEIALANIATTLPLPVVRTRDLYNNTLSCLYTAVGHMDGFALRLDQRERDVAEMLMKASNGRYSLINGISVGSNSLIHDDLCAVVKQSYKPETTNISFCCGPTQKPAAWSTDIYNSALIAQSHCSAEGIKRINQVQDLIQKVLDLPKDYKILLMNGSATGALESAFYNLLGNRAIQNFACDVFGHRWAGEIEIMINFLKKHGIKYPFFNKMEYNVVGEEGELPNETQLDPESDLVLVYTGTSNGHVWHKNILSKAGNKDRLIIVDATSAAFVEELPWQCLDAVAFSFQKALGCEAGLGCLVLSPKACDAIRKNKNVFLANRILRLTPEWLDKVASGNLINTISMLNLHEAYNSLAWAESKGGLSFLRKQAIKNQDEITKMMPDTLEFVIRNPEARAKSLLAVRPVNKSLQNWDFVNRVAELAKANGVVSIAGHPHEVPCWRFWTGPTMQNLALGFAKFLECYDKLSSVMH